MARQLPSGSLAMWAMTGHLAGRGSGLDLPGTGPCRSWNVPIGPPGGKVARWTVRGACDGLRAAAA
jgi:hypothetical protein